MAPIARPLQGMAPVRPDLNYPDLNSTGLKGLQGEHCESCAGQRAAGALEPSLPTRQGGWVQAAEHDQVRLRQQG